MAFVTPFPSEVGSPDSVCRAVISSCADPVRAEDGATLRTVQTALLPKGLSAVRYACLQEIAISYACLFLNVF